MSAVKDAVDKARSDARALQQKIEANTAKNQAALRADLESASTHAHQLAASVKTLAEGQRADAKQHLSNAAARLEDAATRAKTAASATELELKKANQAALDRARAAVQNLSHAVAAKRATASKN
ncbi:MAG: hypothetical protein ACLPYS_20730 [Vulcanimicrobiaceae bacterium]